MKNYNFLESGPVAQLGGRWSVESKLYELSSETYAWDNLEGETIYFSQKEVLDNNTRIWTSSDNPDVLLYENCSNSYDGNYSGNTIICKGITYNFTDDGTVCLLTDSQNNNIKIQHSVNKINGKDVVNTSYINYITDASGRCYKLTKSKKAGGKDVYTQLSVFESERSDANPIQMGDTNYTVGYEYTSHSDGLQALLTSVTYPDGSRVTYEYSNNQLVKITDVNDNILEINYLPSCDNTVTNIVTGYEKYKIVNGKKYTIEKTNIDNSDTYRRVFSDINGEVVTQQYNRKLDLISEMDNEGNAYFISYDAYGKIVRWVVPEETNNILINGNFESELSDEGIIDGWAYLSNEDNAYLENVDNSSCLVVNDNSQGREGVGQDIETVDFGTQLFTVGCTVQGTSLVPSEGTFVGIEIFAFDADGNYLKYDGEITEDEEPYFSLEIDNTTNSKQYIMDAFVLREEVVQISVYLSSINQIADVKFDDVVLYPSSIIINNSENDTSTCGCGTACTMGEGCACECENSQNCNCVSCRTHKKDEYVYNDITGKLEYVEYKNTDGKKQ